jgi:DNA mismatch endonuclease (patch repair protein)
MLAVRRRDTKPELALRSELHRRGRRFFVDKSPISKMRSRADLLFPRLRVAVFVDGCFWHRCPIHGSVSKTNAEWWEKKLDANVQRDRTTDDRLTQAGWRVVRVWEHERAVDAADRVEAALVPNVARSK